jgi:AraC family transcriptional regulator
MDKQQLANSGMSTAEYAYFSSARQLVLSSEAANWSTLTAHLFDVKDLRRARINVPAPMEDVITIQVDGVTELTGKITKPSQPHRASPGDICLIPRGEPSDWEWTTACQLLCLYVSPKLLERMAVEDANLPPERVELVPGTNTRDPLLYQLGVTILYELQSLGLASRLYVDTLTHSLAAHLLRTHTAFTANIFDSQARLVPTMLRRAQEYIHDNLARDLTLSEIAAAAGLSPYYLARRFKHTIGSTVHQYVVAQRLEAARQLLLAGTHTIAEVATLTGFADQSHLHRLFKQRFGVTPGSLLRRPEQQQETNHD